MGPSGLKSLCSRAEALIAPQLLLEALIATKGGFDRMTALNVEALRYISASGGEPAGTEMQLQPSKIPELLPQLEPHLAALIARFDNPLTPYSAVLAPVFTTISMRLHI